MDSETGCASSRKKRAAPIVSRPAAKLAAAGKTKKSSSSLGDFALMAKRAKQASAFLKALSHESRLLILCRLCEGERSVTELEELLLLRQSSVSQQLARLRLDGLVQTKRNGKTIHYRWRMTLCGSFSVPSTTSFAKAQSATRIEPGNPSFNAPACERAAAVDRSRLRRLSKKAAPRWRNW